MRGKCKVFVRFALIHFDHTTSKRKNGGLKRKTKRKGEQGNSRKAKREGSGRVKEEKT